VTRYFISHNGLAVVVYSFCCSTALKIKRKSKQIQIGLVLNTNLNYYIKISSDMFIKLRR